MTTWILGWVCVAVGTGLIGLSAVAYLLDL